LAFVPRLGQSGPVTALQLERGGWFRLWMLLGSCVLGCGSRRVPAPPEASPPEASPPEGAGSPARAEETAWASGSSSPSWAEPGVLPLPGCPRYEQSLLAAARAVASSEAAGHPAWEVSEVVAQVRAAGGPFVWPRLWTLQGGSLGVPEIQASLAAWLEHAPPLGARRCGAAQVERADGSLVLAAVVVDALADLDLLPTRVRLGQWLRLRARLLVPTRTAETVLLGPRGAPRVIPTELRPGEIRAVFSLDQPGMWRIQLLLGMEKGPRPALEAWAFVDEAPNLSAAIAPAPGEELAARFDATSEAARRSLLLDLLNAARRSEQRLPVRRDERLDQLAQAHAEAMRSSQQTAHDVGQGLPSERLRRAGIEPSLVGENVAYAGSLGRAHRALWDSPAHRGTLLEPAFRAVGLGVAAEGEAVWVCELFAND
jgi:Cysteine-rich secretory protein family